MCRSLLFKKYEFVICSDIEKIFQSKKHVPRSNHIYWTLPFPLTSLSKPFSLSHVRSELEKGDKESTSMDSQGQTTSLQRLQNVEKRIVKVLELAGGVMDELASPVGPRKDVVQNHCLEFMQLIKDIQVALRDEIKSACEYRPFEKCDYGPRIANEICYKKVEFIMSQLDAMKQTIDEYHAAV